MPFYALLDSNVALTVLRRERTPSSTLALVITFPLDIGWISFSFFTICYPQLHLPSSNEMQACTLLPLLVFRWLQTSRMTFVEFW